MNQIKANEQWAKKVKDEYCPMMVNRDLAGQHSRCRTTCKKGITYRSGIFDMGMAQCTWKGWKNYFEDDDNDM
jgi:hypothetical protein